MTDFTTLRTADHAGFADGVVGEVVMEDEPFGDFAAGVTVEVLGFVAGSERGQAERLGFAAREEGGAVRAREQADFAGERADFSDAAPVSCSRMELPGLVMMCFSATSYSCIGPGLIVAGNPKILLDVRSMTEGIQRLVVE